MTRYATSIRIGSFHGPLVWADTIEAETPADAKVIAKRQFFTPLVIDPSWSQTNQDAGRKMEASCAKTREQAHAMGFFIVANKSRAR